MSVYYKEKASYLRDSINSMLNQTLEPDEIVLVKDGPLTEELERVLDEYRSNTILKIVELKDNVGLGDALRIGLDHCRNNFVARMDTDDISETKRCEKQVCFLIENHNVSVVGSSIAEFVNSPDNIIAYKKVFENYDQIKRLMKYRNALNHPSVMFRKNDVVKAGNYKPWFLNEDYYLWIRMIQKGFILRNIKKPLVKMRITCDTYLRRGGWKYFMAQKRFMDYMLKNEICNEIEYIYNYVVRICIHLMIPNSLRKVIYIQVLRQKNNK